MKLKFIIFITFLLLFSACQLKGKQQAAPLTTQIGTQGIVMSFLQNSPPPRVFDDAPENLQFLIQVNNKGTYTLDSRNRAPQILMQIGGHDDSVIYLDKPPIAGCFPGNEVLCLLEGKSQFNPDGGVEVVDWSAYDIVLPGEIYKPNFQITSCYYYETTATPGLCIDPRPRNVIPEKKACMVKDVALGGGQGAPIAVTKIEEEILRDRIQFKIFLQNVGGGDLIWNQVPLNECLRSGLGIDAFNKVVIQADLGGAPAVPLTCNPNPIRMTNNQGFTICSVGLSQIGVNPATPAFTAPLSIKLSYNYKSSIQKQVEIRATPR